MKNLLIATSLLLNINNVQPNANTQDQEIETTDTRRGTTNAYQYTFENQNTIDYIRNTKQVQTGYDTGKFKYELHTYTQTTTRVDKTTYQTTNAKIEVSFAYLIIPNAILNNVNSHFEIYIPQRYFANGNNTTYTTHIYNGRVTPEQTDAPMIDYIDHDINTSLFDAIAVYQNLNDNIDGTYENLSRDENIQLQPNAIIDITDEYIKNNITRFVIYGYFEIQQNNPTMYYGVPYYNFSDIRTNKMTLQAYKLVTPIESEGFDVAGLMYTIIGLPFSFISQAFDLTLFPGTANEINISNLFLSLIAIAFLLWIIKIILGRADLGNWIGENNRQKQALRNENRRHADQMKLQETKHNNLMAEKQDKESKRHSRNK